MYKKSLHNSSDISPSAWYDTTCRTTGQPTSWQGPHSKLPTHNWSLSMSRHKQLAHLC